MTTISHDHLFQISHVFPDIAHNKVNNVSKSAIFNLIKLEFVRLNLSMKSHILFHTNGLAIWHGFPDIMHVKVNNDHFLFHRFEIFQSISPREIAHFFLW